MLHMHRRLLYFLSLLYIFKFGLNIFLGVHPVKLLIRLGNKLNILIHFFLTSSLKYLMYPTDKYLSPLFYP